jgi:probable HAF family extracellular repeat protein
MKRSKSCIRTAKILFASSLVFSALSATALAAQPAYRLTDLGAFTANGNSAAVDINNHGQIVGYSWTAGQQTSATIWNNGQISLLGESGVLSSATAINDAGVAVGYNHTNGIQNAIVWTNGQESILSGNTAIALDINNHGVIAGASYNGGPTTWTNGNADYLPVITSPYFSFARGINSLGNVVGSFEIVSPDFQIYTRAALWTGGSVIDLGTANGFNSSYAEKINDAGDIVGQSNNGYLGEARATLWRAGQAVDLGSLNGGTEASFAKDINRQGQIVGYSQIDPLAPENSARAVIWFDDFNPVALDTLIDPLDPMYGQVSLYTAMGINDLGQIVGYGSINGKERAFLLTPLAAVPEPENYALIMLGLGLIGLAKKYKATQV